MILLYEYFTQITIKKIKDSAKGLTVHAQGQKSRFSWVNKKERRFPNKYLIMNIKIQITYSRMIQLIKLSPWKCHFLFEKKIISISFRAGNNLRLTDNNYILIYQKEKNENSKIKDTRKILRIFRCPG